MGNLRPFQIILLAAFGLLAIVGLIFLSLYQASQRAEDTVYGDRVLIWGTLSADAFREQFQEITKVDKPFKVVSYVQVPEESFDSELVNAIAEDRSPDMVVLSADALVSHRSKLIPVPYESVPLREFKDTFVDGAEIFAFAEGVYGIPFVIDPVVMYWNRDLFSSNGLSQPPATWESVITDVVPRLTIHTTNRDINQSGVSFGEYRNVENAKKILMTLALQTGSQMVLTDETRYDVNLNRAIGDDKARPFESVVQFYTDFSNVNSPLYSWNRGLQSAQNAFLSGRLGLYFGMSSEYRDVADKNPNLNFDVAEVPQGAGATVRRTYGDIYAFAIPKASKNPQGAFLAARVLSGDSNTDALSRSLGMASVRRDVIARGDQDPFRRVTLQSALTSRSWLDPDPKKSESIFMQMVEDVVSNRARVGEAVKDAIDRLVLAF